ncbi:MAG TPA: glucan 1,4-alpha-glucosidase [Chthoniobacterales bacterium]
MRTACLTGAAALFCAWTAPAVQAGDGVAPGAPGASANWTTGNKQGLGTAVSRDSKVWYTLSGGALSEVYFPSGDKANVRSLEFAVTDGTSFVDRESENTTHKVELVDDSALIYRQINTAKSGRYQITKTYITDVKRATVLMQVSFKPLIPGNYRLFALYDPAIGNSSLHDTASRSGNGSNVALLASDGSAASALVSASGFVRTSSGFVGTSDGWTDLVADHRLDWNYDTAPDGNVLQVGELPLETKAGRETSFTLALAFGNSAANAELTARASLRLPFVAHAAAYALGWHAYLRSLNPPPSLPSRLLRTQYNVSVMTVKAHEDKTYPGAFLASLTLPWGFDANADEGGGGYHYVWARDMYQQVTAMLAAGDRVTADRAVTWLFTRQQSADGTFPQTSTVDGTAQTFGIQLDQTAFPLILAWTLGRTDNATWEGVRKAADALVSRGPTTPQERWEETGGYSNSTIPAEIAGLVTAADLARQRGDSARAGLWLGVADEWQRSIEKWLFTTNGPYGDGRYYVRIDDNGDPNDGSERDSGNASGVHKDNMVVDGGFLELIRLGVKAPNDPYVAESLPEMDASIATDTPSGRVWHRYTFDGYGDKADGSAWGINTPGTTGRAWPLLGGERGEYEVANGRDGLPYLRTMANTANDGYMIPEQVWDQPEPAPAPYNYQPGKATGSASPLAWAMAQYVRLARAIGAGRPVETPAVVARRYASGVQLSVPALAITSPLDGIVADQPEVIVQGTTDAQRVYVGVGGTVQTVTPQNGAFEVTVPLAEINNRITVVAVAADGGTSMRQVSVITFGTRLGGLTDPAGDDNGPGSYVYPTNSAFNPGAFDLTGFDVYSLGDDVVFVARIASEVLNPWGGNQISVQRLNVYLGAGAGDSVPALAGTNMNTATPWSVAISADGFNLAGVFAPDGTQVADVRITALPQTRQIALAVPRSALGSLDPATASYGVAMLCHGGDGEGIGFVRPVYSFEYWNNPPSGMGWVKEYRFGGGAGEIDFGLASKDTDTRDPNAIDVIVGPGQTQSSVLDWQTASPVPLPMLPIGQ